jgi:hypothetical protein
VEKTAIAATLCSIESWPLIWFRAWISSFQSSKTVVSGCRGGALQARTAHACDVPHQGESLGYLGGDRNPSSFRASRFGCLCVLRSQDIESSLVVASEAYIVSIV